MDKSISAGSSTSVHSFEPRKLLIECGEYSLHEFDGGERRDVIGQIETVRGIANAHGIDLEILIYSGVSSPLSGGRPNKISLDRAAKLAHLLNAEGFRFCLAINGGLTLRPTLSKKVLDQVDPLLETIALSGHTFRIRNSVVITHPGLLTHIRTKFPELKITASCIQPLYPFAEHDYLPAFREYDYVVPLNQHATPGFLDEYREFVDKMLIFLTLGCGIPHFAKCYLHYLEIESEYPTNEAATERVSPKSLNVIPCQLSEPHRGCDDGALIARDEDLRGVLRMGVRKFKIPRNGFLRRQVLSKLLHMFDQQYPTIPTNASRIMTF